jgi:hypothetical protein
LGLPLQEVEIGKDIKSTARLASIAEYGSRN